MKDQGPGKVQELKPVIQEEVWKGNLLVQATYKARADRLPQTTASPLEWGEPSTENKIRNSREAEALQMAQS